MYIVIVLYFKMIVMDIIGGTIMVSRIRELRKREDMTQEDLAELVNASQQSVSQWERIPMSIPSDVLYKLADYFHVSVDYLLERTDMMFFPDKYYSQLTEKIAGLSLDDQIIVNGMIDLLLERQKNKKNVKSNQ